MANNIDLSFIFSRQPAQVNYEGQNEASFRHYDLGLGRLDAYPLPSPQFKC